MELERACVLVWKLGGSRYSGVLYSRTPIREKEHANHKPKKKAQPSGKLQKKEWNGIIQYFLLCISSDLFPNLNTITSS